MGSLSREELVRSASTTRSGGGTEDNMFESLHEEVRRTLAPFGILVSRTILKEIGAAETR